MRVRGKTSIPVGRGPAKYSVKLSSISELSTILSKETESASQIVLFVDEEVMRLYGKELASVVKMGVRKAHVFSVARGERAKSPKRLMEYLDCLLRAPVDRSSLVVAVGGGVTTDLIGCASSLCLRGLRWVAVPTTLLGQLDASIGGKTGINSPRGKNLIGTFWPPQSVIICPEFVLTQSQAEFSSGLAEAVKYFAIAGRPSPGLIRRALESFPDLTPHEIAEVVIACAKIKARIVTRDEREAGVRAYLNFGHTIGHALEKCSDYRGLSHGRAVAAGMCGALWLSEHFGMAGSRRLRNLKSLAETLAGGRRVKIEPAAAVSALWYDKKRRDGKLNFVLLEDIGKPYTMAVDNRNLIREATRRGIEALG